MIRFTYPLLNQPIDFIEGDIPVLVLESPKLFREMYAQFILAQNQEKTEICISENYQEIPFHKNIEILSPPYVLDFSQRKILNKLYSSLEKEAYSEDLYVKTGEITAQITRYLNELVLSSELAIDFEQVKLQDLFKACEVRIEQNEHLAEQLCSYFDLINDFFGIHIFACFHLKEYLETSELSLIYQHCIYKKFNLFLVESRDHLKLPEEQIIIIDCDLCQIT